MKRFVSVWFPFLCTDWFSLETPSLHGVPFVLRTSVQGRMMVTAVNKAAQQRGIFPGLTVADACAIAPDLVYKDDVSGLAERVLRELACWSIRFSPFVAVDAKEGLFIDASGCTHLWGGEQAYVHGIETRLAARGYESRVAMAGNPRVAWAVARYGSGSLIIEEGQEKAAIGSLPPEALAIADEEVSRLHKLGLRRIHQFMDMPRPVLRRRFGMQMLLHIDRALGKEVEQLSPVIPQMPYESRLFSLEPIVTADGIAMALERLLATLCGRLQREQMGLRSAVFKGFRVDNKTIQIRIGTQRPSYHVSHLMRMFENKLCLLEPALGIEVFLLEAPHVEPMPVEQHAMWEPRGSLADDRLAELVDRLMDRSGVQANRYLPAGRYWPEHSFRKTSGFNEEAEVPWITGAARPLCLLKIPEPVEVTAPIPDYPPMLFRYKGELHRIARADGPERIEQAWWEQRGEHRDYFQVEDEQGRRYWLFRLGHYETNRQAWFIHGFFA